MTIRVTFDRQLSNLSARVETLAQMVAGSIEDSITALKQHNLELARRVDCYDAEINRVRFEIEEDAYRLLALQAPVSHDMRFIVATISVVTNLERIGDHAAGIARLVLRMGENPFPMQLPEFDAMAATLKAMLGDAIQAYTRQDQPIADSVIARDVAIDRLHKDIYEKLIAMMTTENSTVENGTFALWISHNMERIGDRCANICERVNYLVTGDLVKPHCDPMP